MFPKQHKLQDPLGSELCPSNHPYSISLSSTLQAYHMLLTSEPSHMLFLMFLILLPHAWSFFLLELLVYLLNETLDVPYLYYLQTHIFQIKLAIASPKKLPANSIFVINFIMVPYIYIKFIKIHI